MKKNYKIARIIDRYTVIINAGKRDGIVKGMQFEVLGNSDDAVLDPDTKEILGFLSAPKAIIRVNEVHDKYSFCGNSESYISPIKQSSTFRISAGSPLNVNPADVRPASSNISRQPISKGDVVSFMS